MTATHRRAVTFNANQFDRPGQITADLDDRIVGADVVIVQEAVGFDLARYAHKRDGWAAHQLDAGENNGHANTAVLYRPENGPIEDTICLFIGDAKDTRARYLVGIKQGGCWYLSLHLFPRRDSKLNPKALDIAGGWAKENAGESQVWGLDRNQVTIAALEAATELRWHGGTADPMGGILTNLPVSKAHEFAKGHSDHRGYALTVAVPEVKKPTPRIFHAPSPEYVGPSPHVMHDAAGHPLNNKPIDRVVMHCTVSPCVAGGRYAIARLFKAPGGRPASSHYCTDPGGAAQIVFDGLVAEHAPPNPHSIGIEQCDPLFSQAWDKAHAGRWHDAPHQSMLHHSANLVARLCLAYDIPARWLTTGQVKQGQRGICGHVNVSEAFHESSHWDPGPAFPVEMFMGMVHRRIARLEGRAVA